MKKGRFTTVYTIEKKLRHHIIEWLATVLAIWGAVVNAQQDITGFYFYGVSNLLWISFAVTHKHWSLVIMNAVFLCINVYAVFTWSSLGNVIGLG